VWYTSLPTLSDVSCRSRVICVGRVGMLTEPARCGTLIHLIVMISVKGEEVHFFLLSWRYIG